MAAQVADQGAKPQEAVDQGGSAQEVCNQDMVNFLDLLRKLVDNASTAWIDRVLKDNENMKMTVTEKSNDQAALSRQISRLCGELDKEVEKSKNAIAESESAKTKAQELTAEIETAKKTITGKDEQLQQDATEINKLKGNIDVLDKEVKARDETIKKQKQQQASDSARMKGLEGTLAATKTELENKLKELQDVQSLCFEVKEGSKEFVLKEIEKVYTYAKVLASKYFNEDLPDDILANTSLIEEIGKLVRPIPFPASNSQAAKKVRIAAFLASLGSRLADRIYLPFYAHQGEDREPDSIAVMLSDLSITDPKKELHIRSVLLAISPDEQKEVAYVRAQEIANEIFGTLGILLSTDKQAQFHADIRKLCRLAVESWDTLRCLKEKVEPFTEASEETGEYWLPAELESINPAKKPAVGTKPNGLGSKPSMHSLKSANKVILVWPGFSYGTEVLKQGHMLLDTQVKLADEEVGPQRRTQRRMQRAAGVSSPLQSHRLSTGRKPKMLSIGGD